MNQSACSRLSATAVPIAVGAAPANPEKDKGTPGAVLTPSSGSRTPQAAVAAHWPSA